MAGEAILAPLVASNGPYTCSVAPVTRTTITGAAAAGTAVVVTAFVDSAPETFEIDVENIKGMSTLGANNVWTNTDFTIEINEILQQDLVSKLAAIFYGATRYVKVIQIAGLDTITYWGIMVGGGRNVVNGKSTFMIRVKRVEVGQTNPALS